MLVYASSLLSVSIILPAGLSFIGLGARPPTPEWGLMLATLRNAIWNQPVLAALPGARIFVVSLAFNLLSDGAAQRHGGRTTIASLSPKPAIEVVGLAKTFHRAAGASWPERGAEA